MTHNLTSGRDKMNHIKISLPFIDIYTIILVQLNRMIHEISYVMLRYLAKDICVLLPPLSCVLVPRTLSLLVVKQRINSEV